MKHLVPLLLLFSILFSACSAIAGAPQAAPLDLNNWDSVVAAAKGQTVNWYIWGGSNPSTPLSTLFMARR